MGPSARDSTAAPRLTAILSKRPVAGRVKTRLSPPLALEEAAALAEGMLRDAVARCTAAAGFRTALYYTPPEDAAWFRAAFPELDLRPQRGAGLAERLAHCFVEALAEPDTRSLVAIGSDQPLVSTARIEAAHRALEDGADLVLGPDHGGGYYLIGQRTPHPALFTEVPMSGVNMCAETVRLAEVRGLSTRLLEHESDVDVADDLERLRRDLAAWRGRGGADESDFPRHTEARLHELFPDPS